MYNSTSTTPITTALRWFSAPIFLLLASCATTEPYPDRWPKPEQDSRIGECPLIVGVYREYGDAPNGCQTYQKRCNQLSYALLSGGVGYKEFFEEGFSDWHGFNHANVRLNQPEEGMLEIEMLDGDGKKMHQESLSMKDGDFSCDGKRLNLKGRAIAAVFGISNVVGSIGRSFFRSSDGSLIMESEQSTLLHHVFILLPISESSWVMWPPVK